VAADGARTILLHRSLNPSAVSADRGVQAFQLALPPGGAGQIEFKIGPGADGNTSFDWTYWHDLRFGITIK
jgi:hypothetical protein